MTPSGPAETAVTLAHGGAYDGDTPLHVYVHGHHLSEEAALDAGRHHLAERGSRENRLDELAGEEEAPRIEHGAKGWLVTSSPDEDGVTWMSLNSDASHGGEPVWSFEVNEHLRPRCEVGGCVRTGLRAGRLDTRLLCAGHYAIAQAREEVLTSLARLDQAATTILGYASPTAPSAFASTAEARDYALRGLERDLEDFEGSTRLAAATMAEASEKGYELAPMRYRLGPWNMLAEPPHPAAT